MINERWSLVVSLALSLVLPMLYIMFSMRNEIIVLNQALVDISKNIAMKESLRMKIEADQLHLFKPRQEAVEISELNSNREVPTNEAVCHALDMLFSKVSNNEEEITKATSIIEGFSISRLRSICEVRRDEVDQNDQKLDQKTTVDSKSTVATQPKPSQTTPQRLPAISEGDLLEAAEKGSLEEVEYLVRNGVNVNCKDGYGGWTPLHFSAGNGYFEVVKYLLQQGADIHCKDGYGGQTPLHWSAIFGHLEVVKYLLQQGADIHCKANDGETPLHGSAWKGHLEVVKYLLQQGADIHCKDNGGMTPLHDSAMNGRLEVVKYLLQQGADKTIQAKGGRTPYDCIGGSGEVHKQLRSLLRVN